MNDTSSLQIIALCLGREPKLILKSILNTRRTYIAIFTIIIGPYMKTGYSLFKTFHQTLIRKYSIIFQKNTSYCELFEKK